MDVEQTLSLDDYLQLLTEMAEETDGKGNAANQRAFEATTKHLRILEENERDRYWQERDALLFAIAIIKAAKEVAENAQYELRGRGRPTPLYSVSCNPMTRLLSLLSPEQAKEV